MALTFERAVETFEHAVRHPLDAVITPQQVVNEVGTFLYGSRPWKFLARGLGYLSLRAQIEAGTATTTSTTLTKTAAFTDYTFLEGDVVEIATGSSATAGFYLVASKTDANNIVLATAPGNSAANVTFTLHTDACALPANFGELIAQQALNSDFHTLDLVGLQTLLDLRGSQIPIATTNFYGALTYARPTGGGEPVPRLELYPAPKANEAGRLRIFYREAWRDMDEDTGFIDVPQWFEGLFLHALREWAQGYEGKGEDEGGIWDRTDRILQSGIYLAAARMDGRMQPNYGQQRGGNADGFMYHHVPSADSFRSTSLVQGP